MATWLRWSYAHCILHPLVFPGATLKRCEWPGDEAMYLQPYIYLFKFRASMGHWEELNRWQWCKQWNASFNKYLPESTSLKRHTVPQLEASKSLIFTPMGNPMTKTTIWKNAARSVHVSSTIHVLTFIIKLHVPHLSSHTQLNFKHENVVCQPGPTCTYSLQ